MDRLRTMEVFVAVAEEAGFAAAARRLNMSAPSATRAVAELEQRLGARLLHRTTRSVRLTDAGGRYLADSKRLLAEIVEADRHAAGLHTAPKGHVSISASLVFGRIIMTPILTDLLEEYPEITVGAIFVDRMVHLVDEGIDVVVRIAELPDSSLVALRVGRVRRILCASPAYLDKRGRPDVLADLDQHDLIDFVHETPGGEWRFAPSCGNYRPRSRLHLNNADAAITAAGADKGITRVLSYMVTDEVAAGRLELVLDHLAPPAVPVHIIHKEPGQTSARVRAVVDFLAERLKKVPAIN